MSAKQKYLLQEEQDAPKPYMKSTLYDEFHISLPADKIERRLTRMKESRIKKSANGRENLTLFSSYENEDNLTFDLRTSLLKPRQNENTRISLKSIIKKHSSLQLTNFGKNRTHGTYVIG